MVAAGGDELSDAVLGAFADDTVINYAEAGVIAPLTEYCFNTDISYYIHESFERLGWSYMNQVTMPDNEIYCIPRVNESISNANPDKMWVYEPWLVSAGIDPESIETRDDFKEALRALVTSDPNGNGKADECGIVGYSTVNSWFCYLMNTFVYSGNGKFMDVNDGQVSFAFQSEKRKEGLEYIKGMYDEGLISPLIFSQNSASFKSMLNAETTIVSAFCQSGPGTIDEADRRRVEYIGIKPLNSDANDGKPLETYAPAIAEGRFLVNSKAADIENTFRFGDYMTCLKISVTQGYGQEGIDWMYPNSNDKSMYDSLGYPAYMISCLP